MNFVSPTSSVASIAWRLPIACQIIFTIAVSVLIFGVPESPRWLFQQGRETEAIQVLCQVYDLPPTDKEIIKEAEDIREAMRLEEENAFRWRNLLQRDSVQTGRRVLLAWGMQFMKYVSIIPSCLLISIHISLVKLVGSTLLYTTSLKLSPRMSGSLAKWP